MNATDIIRLLNTNHYAPADLDEVNKLCRNFPEFSVAHMLKVRIMETLGYEKQEQLKVAAVYSMDRGKLYQLVTGVGLPAEAIIEDEPQDDSTGIIQFSDENNEHADVIIEQHAPYAGQDPDSNADLLELDEEEEELLEIVDEPAAEADETPAAEAAEETTEELTADTLLAMEKDDASLEEGSDENSTRDLITSFINGDPGPIRADKETDLKGDVSVSSIKEHDGFITDTLAKIYVKQGLFAKAIYAYEKLSLKYPEKSAYFAAQIEKISNINHS